MNPDKLNSLTSDIIGAAIEVHRQLGPGLLESAYEACLVHELRKRGLQAFPQVGQPLVYDGLQMDIGYRLDVLVENTVIIELKAVEKMMPLYDAQLLTYLRLSGKKVGLLINFNVERLVDGLKRLVN